MILLCFDTAPYRVLPWRGDSFQPKAFASMPFMGLDLWGEQGQGWAKVGNPMAALGQGHIEKAE